MNRLLPGRGDFSPPDDDALDHAIEQVDAGDIEQEIAEGIAGDDRVHELVEVLADASSSGLIQCIAEGRPLDNRDLVQLQAFRALARLADDLARDRNERIIKQARDNVRAARRDH